MTSLLNLRVLIVLVIGLLIMEDGWICFGSDQLSEEILQKLLPNLKNVRLVTNGDLVSKRVLFEDDDIEKYGCSCYAEGDLDNNGMQEVAICGVYFDFKVKEDKPFLLILTKQKNGIYRKVFFKEFERFFFLCRETESIQSIKLQKDEVLRIGFKANTDAAGGVFWENNRYIFKPYKPNY